MSTSEDGKYIMPCLVYSRVCGYMTPVQAWNVGKKQEFKDRNTYDKVFDEVLE